MIDYGPNKRNGPKLSIKPIPLNIEKLDKALDPDKEEERKIEAKEEIEKYEETYGSVDLEKSIPGIFEILWYSQLPCTDVEFLTSSVKDELSFIKKCFWKDQLVSCNALFQKRPTDRGMCCSFNMENAERTLKESDYSATVALRQSKDSEYSFESEKKPQWYLENDEPRAEPGVKKGLTLVVDRHSDKLAPGSVSDNFLGFPMVVDDRKKFPLVEMSGEIVRPGYQTNVKVSAVHFEGREEIRQYKPDHRNCYFPDEFTLKYHRQYSHQNCLFECKLEFAANCLTMCNQFEQTCHCKEHMDLKNMDLTKHNDTCVPWFYPLEIGKVRKICNPWNTKKFKEILRNQIPSVLCDHCLPDCSVTKYETSLSYAELLKCDSTTVGSFATGKICDLITGELNPAPWVTVAKNEFEFSNQSIPWYLDTNLLNAINKTSKFSDKRSILDVLDDDGSEIFISELKKNPMYDAFQKDIGIINVYFSDNKITRYITKNRKTTVDFMYEIGGSLGLVMGISVISVVEIIYWIAYRLFTTIAKQCVGYRW